MLSVEARVYPKREEEGGFTRPGFSGMQPFMDIRGDLVACKIINGPEGELLELGEERDVRIDLPYGEEYADVLRRGFRFRLKVGGRVIGHGRILQAARITGPCLVRCLPAQEGWSTARRSP